MDTSATRDPTPGDSWSHDIVVEKVLEPEPGVGYPRVLEGARACPPEDCGGPPGYLELLDALMDLEHPDHADVAAFVGAGFDPEAFEPQVLNAELVAAHLVWQKPGPGSGRSDQKPHLRLVR